MHDILQFHKLHGSAVVISENGSVATRSGDFCNGIAFSAQPLKVGQKVCLELSQAQEWSGALRLGVTFHDPSKISVKDLPRYACPDLTNKEGFWARGILESYAESGNRLTFYVNGSGQLHFFINNEHKGILLNHLPTSKRLWALFDIYGNTHAAKLVHADEAPVEIVARGSAALRAYQLACESGTQPVFRTRLMLVGQDRVGKTSLKKALTGQSHDRQEESTDGIDLSGSCSFNLRDRHAWKLARDGAPVDGFAEDSSDQLASVSHLCSLETLEEEYHQAIATNIVQELLHQRKVQKSSPVEKENAEPKRSAGHKKHKHSLFSAKRKEQQRTESSLSGPPDIQNDLKLTSESLKSVDGMLHEMPDRVVDLVDELLREKDAPLSLAQQQSNSGANIILNIWDFAGQAAYYTTHQVFLSSRAVYIIVFNLCHDLTETSVISSIGNKEGELSHLEYMDLWMHSIHTHSAQNTRGSADNITLSPPIFIVGTHRDSVHEDPAMRDKLVAEKLQQVQEMIRGKAYEKHIVNQIYVVENTRGEDEQVALLRRHVEEVASKEIYMGEQIPLKWLRLEQAFSQLVENKTYFSSLDQIEEVAKSVGLCSAEELKTVLEFYHDLGVIVYYGGAGRLDVTLGKMLILQPQWLIDMFTRIITTQDFEHSASVNKELWHRLHQFGLLDERLIDHVWADIPHQKSALLALMQKFDLIAERLPSKGLISNRLGDHLDRAFYVPSCIRYMSVSESPQFYISLPTDVVFYMDFNGFLPDGLYHRVVTRAVCWSQECGGHEPSISFRQARFFLDSEHDFILQMAHPSLAHIKVFVVRVVDLDESDEGDSSDSTMHKALPSPKPNSCAKVRNFLESTLSDLRELWMKRISYQAVVPCLCDQSCAIHSVPRCRQEGCLHFLSLDQCLANKVICCGHRRIKTLVYRKSFPSAPPVVKIGPVLSDQVVKQVEHSHQGNIEASTQGSDLPSWCRSCAKLLNGGAEGQDWLALAKKLGYKKNRIDKIGDDINPGLALITDWIISCGNTPLSVDMILSCLEQLHREDIVEIIHKSQENEEDSKQVFISYQWDSQDEVSLLRDRLEKAGFTCWMDIGQMGGGDHLYSRIDEGIRKAKLVLACITPKYVVSHHCHKEISLADLLRKPIIPVIYEKITWPPPGAMALIFASLCYVDMKGIGGHGGSGIHADLEHRYQEILQRTSNYASPVPLPEQKTEGLHLEAFPLDSSLHSGESLHSFTASQQDTFLIPGYSSDQSVSVRSTLPPQPMALSPGGLGASGSRAAGLGQVEQVHVTKCAVCNIL